MRLYEPPAKEFFRLPKQCRHHSFCFGFHRDSSIQFGVKKECRGFHDILMRVIILYQPYITA